MLFLGSVKTHLVIVELLVEMTEPRVTRCSLADPSVTCPVSNSAEFQRDNSNQRSPSEIRSRFFTFPGLFWNSEENS